MKGWRWERMSEKWHHCWWQREVWASEQQEESLGEVQDEGEWKVKEMNRFYKNSGISWKYSVGHMGHQIFSKFSNNWQKIWVNNSTWWPSQDKCTRKEVKKKLNGGDARHCKICKNWWLSERNIKVSHELRLKVWCCSWSLCCATLDSVTSQG